MNQPPSLLNMLLSRHTRRRAFITLLGGVTVAWPLEARSQRVGRMRRIGVLLPAVPGEALGGLSEGPFSEAV